MLLIQCPGCLASAYADCTCPPAQAGHLPPCPMVNLGALVTCVPGRGCCAEAHDHDAAANACPGGHGDCPVPEACAAWEGATADTRHTLYDGPSAGACPGGHCHKDIEGCTVCRPLVITAMPGSAAITPAVG